MFCEKCGAALEDNCVFCENCGEKCVQEKPAAPIARAEIDSRLSVRTQPAQSTPKRAIKLGMKQKIIIAVCLAVAVICAIGYGIMSNLSKPEKVVDKIVSAMQKGDYEALYGYLDVPQGEFLTKEMFVSANTKYAELAEKGDFDLDFDSSSLYSLRNIKTYSITPDKRSKSALSSDYEIEYTLAGSSDVYTMDISLVKSGKKFLFFDDYRMDAEPFITDDVELQALPLLTLSINGTVLTPSSTENYYGSERNIYTIPYMFTGTYDFKLTSDFTKEVNQAVTIDRYGNLEGLNYEMEPSDALTQTINDKTTSFIDALFKGIESNSDFSAIKAYTVSDSDMEDIYLRYRNSYTSSYYILDKLTYSNLKVTDTEFGTNKYKINISLDVLKVSHENPENVYEPSDEPREENLEIKMSLIFKYENGDWLIESMSSRYY